LNGTAINTATAGLGATDTCSVGNCKSSVLGTTAWIDQCVIADAYVGALATPVNVSDQSNGATDSVSISSLTTINASDQSNAAVDSVSISSSAVISASDASNAAVESVIITFFNDNFAAEGAAGTLNSSIWNGGWANVQLASDSPFNGNAYYVKGLGNNSSAQRYMLIESGSTIPLSSYTKLYVAGWFRFTANPPGGKPYGEIFLGGSGSNYDLFFGLQNVSGQNVWALDYGAGQTGVNSAQQVLG